MDSQSTKVDPNRIPLMIWGPDEAKGNLPILLHPPCLSHAEALPVSAFLKVLPKTGEKQKAGEFPQAEPRHSGTEQSCWGPLWGDTSWNLGVAARGASAEKKAHRENKAQVSPVRAWLYPLGVWELAQRGRVAGGTSWWVFIKAVTGQTVLPTVLSSWSFQFCSEGQPVLKGWECAPRTTTRGKTENTPVISNMLQVHKQ